MNAPENFFKHLTATNTAEWLDRDLLHGIDPLTYARFVRQASEVRSTADFAELIETAVQPILPHEMFLAGVGHARGDQIVVQHAIGINYPQLYIEALKNQAIFKGPILTRWLKSGEPQWFNAQDSVPAGLQRWAQAMLSYNMHNVVGHGVKDTNGTGASYCTFANLNLSPTLDHTLVLRLLIPHLHAALLRIWHSLQAEGDNRAKQNIERLTDREREVLRWLVRGKSNPVIAQILSRSEFTIRNQVSRILQKLAVTNRNDAMIVATRIGHSFGIETPKEKQLGCHP